MQGEAARLLGPCPAHTGAEVYKGDTLSSNNPRDSLKKYICTKANSLQHKTISFSNLLFYVVQTNFSLILASFLISCSNMTLSYYDSEGSDLSGI